MAGAFALVMVVSSGRRSDSTRRVGGSRRHCPDESDLGACVGSAAAGSHLAGGHPLNPLVEAAPSSWATSLKRCGPRTLHH